MTSISLQLQLLLKLSSVTNIKFQVQGNEKAIAYSKLSINSKVNIKSTRARLNYTFLVSVQLTLNTSSHCRSSRTEVCCKKGVFKDFAKFIGKHQCWSLSFNKVEKQTLTLVFSCEFCENLKNNFFYRTRPVAASDTNCGIDLFGFDDNFRQVKFQAILFLLGTKEICAKTSVEQIEYVQGTSSQMFTCS